MTSLHAPGRASAWPLRPRQRGTSLIEALVAMAVMAFGMLAVVGVQSTLRMNADIAKQRSEATRIADAQMEQLRTFVSAAAVAGAPMGWDEIVAAAPVDPVLVSANASYHLQQSVVDLAGSQQKAVTVTVTWEDRFGETQRLMVRSILAGAAPGLSGLLSVPPTRTAASQRNSRHPTIPTRAHDIPGGESVFKPRESGTVAWTFNNTTGVITRICIVAANTTSDTLEEEGLVGCVATTAHLLSGYVRFNLSGVTNNLGNGFSVYKPEGDDNDLAWVVNNATGAIVRQCDVGNEDTEDLEVGDLDDCDNVDPPQPISPFNAANDLNRALTHADADDPHWPAMPTSVALNLVNAASHVAGSICFAESLGSMEAAMRLFSVEYFCVIMPKAGDNPDGLWSGRTNLSVSNWSFGNDRDEIRSCRYTLANADVTDNTDHPLNYVDVSGNLINQNFLVVNGTKACPHDVAANPITGDFINTNTRQHQPAP